MNPLKRKVIPAVLAVMVAVPVTAYAAQSQNEPAKPAQSEKQQSQVGEAWKWKDGKHGDFKHHREKMQAFKVHYENYMLLLAEKYTPDQLNEWKAVFAERKALLEQLKNKAADQRKAEQKKEAQSRIREKVKFLPEHSEERKALRKQFTEAVKNNDEAGIRAVLPKLLAQQKEMNGHISAKLKETK